MQSSEILTYENYIFADDKEEFLKNLTPGTDLYYYFTILHALKVHGAELTPDIIKNLNSYKKLFPSNINANMLDLRYLLCKYDSPNTKASEKKEIIDKILKDHLKLNLTHTKPQTSTSEIFSTTDAKYPSVLDPQLISIEHKIERAYYDLNILKEILPQYYCKFNLQNFENSSLGIIEFFLENGLAYLCSFNGVPKLLSIYLGLKRREVSEYNFHIGLFNTLTLDQLIELESIIPSLDANIDFFKSKIQKIFQNEFSSLEIILDTYEAKILKRKLLLKLYNMVDGLTKSFTYFKNQVMVAILANGLETNVIDIELFVNYIDKPSKLYVPSAKIKPNNIFLTNSQFTEVNFLQALNVYALDMLNIDQIVNNYLMILLRNSDNIQLLAQYIKPEILQELLDQIHLHQGIRVEEISIKLGDQKIKNLLYIKKIKLCKYNKEIFKHDEEVKLFVEIKNIQSLLIKIFEFMPESYYKRTNKQLEPTINLDGFIASEELNFNYKESPIIRHIEEFKFPFITKKQKGIFIIEFIGNGLCSRALIRKGRLTYVEKITNNGHLIVIIDENGEICKSDNKTGVWIDNNFYPANTNSQMAIPYAKSEHISNIILVHEDFAELTTMTIKQEHYDFKCAYLYNQESFLMGTKAQIILHPRLYIHNQQLSLRLLKDISIEITNINDRNIPSTTSLDKVTFKDNEDYEIIFPIPARLKEVRLIIKAKISSQSEGKDEINVNSDHIINIISYEGKNQICSAFLKYSDKGYDIHFVGKNGEPKHNIQVNLVLESKIFKSAICTRLQTNNEGIIKLGKLEGIVGIQINSQGRDDDDINGISKKWIINQQQEVYYPNEISMCEGDNLILPLLENTILNKEKFIFLEIIKNTLIPIKNILSLLKFDKKRLILEGLKAGEYLLYVLEVNKLIKINVIKGQYWKHDCSYITNQHGLIEIKEKFNNIVIENLDLIRDEQENIGGDIYTMKLDLYSDNPEKTRIHVFFFTFMNENQKEFVQAIDQITMKSDVSNIPLGLRKNIFMSNRLLSDEYAYVLDRINQSRFIGNTLDRPSLLLKKTFIRETSTQNEITSQGKPLEVNAVDASKLVHYDNYLERTKKPQGDNTKANEAGKSRSMPDSFLNFLANPALVYANVRFEIMGNNHLSIKIPKLNLTKYSSIQIIANNGTICTSQIIPLQHSSTILTKDLTLKSRLKKNCFYSIKRDNTNITKGQKFRLYDYASTEMQIIDSIAMLFDIQQQLILYKGNERTTTNNVGYDIWSFIKQWPNYDHESKLEKYDKYACHELNVFLYFKDSPFFAKVVKPFIKNKLEKDFVDYVLLEDKKVILEYIEPVKLDSLNTFEKALLINFLRNNHIEEAKNIAKTIELSDKSSRMNTAMYKKLFDIVLNSKSKENLANLLPASKAQNQNETQNSPEPLLFGLSNQALISNTNNNFHRNSGGSLGGFINQPAIQNLPIAQQQQSQGQGRVSLLPGGFFSNTPPQNFPISQQQQQGQSQILFGNLPSNIHPSFFGQPQAQTQTTTHSLFSHSVQNPTNIANMPPIQQNLTGAGIGVGFGLSQSSDLYGILPSKISQSLTQTGHDKSKLFENLSSSVIPQAKYPMHQYEKAKQYIERNYYNNNTTQRNFRDSIATNRFWVDLVKYLSQKQSVNEQAFLTPNFIYALSNHIEMLAVLTFIDLPFNPDNHLYTSYEGRGLEIQAGSNFIVFHKEIKEGTSELSMDILITQRFFDPKNRYIKVEDAEDNNVLLERNIEEYEINKIYGCKVGITNCSVANQEFQILVEVPEGSIPVNTGDYTKSHTVYINSYNTYNIDYFFYFPKEGNFNVYPANVSRNGKVLAIAKDTILKVKTKAEVKKLETLKDILAIGTHDDILEFAKTKNLWKVDEFNFNSIYWLLYDKEFYLKFIEILRQRKYYDFNTWKFSLYHNDHDSICELLKDKKILSILKPIKFMKTSLISIDQYQIYDFSSLINSRVHMLSKQKSNILNIEFNNEYQAYLKYLSEVKDMSARHYLPLAYYLLLQDRIEEAIIIFKKIQVEELHPDEKFVLQYDYFSAYIDFYIGYPNFDIANQICKKYLDYPVISWRKLFIDIANQLAEYKGIKMNEIEDKISEPILTENKETKNKMENTKDDILFEVQLNTNQIWISYKNISEFILNFYEINLEILFSRNPFLKEKIEDFSYIKSNLIHKIDVQKTHILEKVSYKIPPNFEKKNVIIQILASNKIKTLYYYSNSLKVHIIEKHGQVKITNKEEKPLSKVYVKCFAKKKNGEISFYKDGYTDLRGRFDYASLNLDNMNTISKFSMFIMSDEYGSLIEEANPPISEYGELFKKL